LYSIKANQVQFTIIKKATHYKTKIIKNAKKENNKESGKPKYNKYNIRFAKRKLTKIQIIIIIKHLIAMTKEKIEKKRKKKEK
jgi:hypothetical protein